MMPIVFWASFVPCVKATKLPDTSCSRRNTQLTRAGERRRITHRTTTTTANPSATPRKGATSEGSSTFTRSPCHCTTSQPEWATADPIMPPTSAWLELEGRPRYQVTRFHVIAPTRPARTTSSVIAPGSTMPFAIVAATLIETKAPAKLSTAASATAVRGDSARVDTLVAIELAVSWKQLVKSKKSATTTTATSFSFTASGVLDDDVGDYVGGRLARVERALERLVDVLPAEHDERVDAVVPEQRRQAVAQQAVALVLVRLQLHERLLDAA